MKPRRIIVEFDQFSLPFKALAEIAELLSAIQMVQGVVFTEHPAPNDRRPRSDKAKEPRNALSNQERAILTAMQTNDKPLTVYSISSLSGVQQNSVRPCLHAMLKQMLVQRQRLANERMRWILTDAGRNLDISEPDAST